MTVGIFILVFSFSRRRRTRTRGWSGLEEGDKEPHLCYIWQGGREEGERSKEGEPAALSPFLFSSNLHPSRHLATSDILLRSSSPHPPGLFLPCEHVSSCRV
ncbi:hypothetical protein E2C01_062433 [Portunus trituberculatus]|uniref:Uncharacterized protein n=1 Tax=Portunus trituberculatus TaxID=210409 RepID=A0A5B7HFA6_PORTR|nr:hypothetical protein [Portunus trituberculatus]